MGDGKIALILDVLGAAREGHVVTEQRDRALSEHTTDAVQKAANRQKMLVLTVGERQLAIPISLVARLEEIPQSSVEKSDRQEVVQYRGQIMPLIRLATLFGTQTMDNADKPLQVVVYSEGGRNLGFIVDSVSDIADAETTSARECVSEELLGSVVIQDRVTDLLNVSTVIRRAVPKFFEAQTHQLAV